MVEISLPSWKERETSARLPRRQRTALQRRETVRPPSPAALALADDLSRRVYNRTAQIRRGFVGRASTNDPIPPLARILRSGRGSAVRLRLYLTLLWIAAGAPHRVSASAQAWATLLDLEDPSGKGARQVRSALRWLHTHQLLEVKPDPGVGATITLLSDLGTGEPYTVPGRSAAKAKKQGDSVATSDRYLKLPETFWTRGWLHVLSGPAIAMLLALLDASRGSNPSEIWFSERVADARYTLTEETRSKGLAELEAFDVLSRKVRAIKTEQLAAPRLRHAYILDTHRLQELPLSEMEMQEPLAPPPSATSTPPRG